MIKIRNVSKSFGGVQAVNNCSFDIHRGKITGLIGPNGAGKTTLFNIITGMIKADKGSLKFKGEDLRGLKTHEIARLGISRTFQQTRLFQNLSILDNLKLAKDVSDEEIKERLARVHITKPLDTLAGDLSYGQQKLVALARSLLYEHELLMLDEPTAGVNPKVRQEMKTILQELRKQGATILVIEHDMDFIMDISDRVVVLSEGKLLKEGTPKQVRKNKQVLEAYLGK